MILADPKTWKERLECRLHHNMKGVKNIMEQTIFSVEEIKLLMLDVMFELCRKDDGEAAAYADACNALLRKMENDTKHKERDK